jgi:putative mRNA 3-end processing factor
MKFRYGNGIEVECGERVLIDPKRAIEGVPVLISHAHSDHVPKNMRYVKTDVYVSEGTASILRRLYGGHYKILHFNESFSLGNLEIYTFPAGHIYGSAGFLINCGNVSLFYTGDVNPHGGLTVESPARIPKADILITEATYGLPIFRFPDPEVTRAKLSKWVIKEVMGGKSPILSAYLIGKSQEVIATLNKYTNLEVSVSKRIADVSEAYKVFNLKYEVGTHKDAHITHRVYDNAARVTGWAILSKRECDFPLSAHADFYDLLNIVEFSNPSKVYTVYGYAEEFAKILKKMGIEASALSDAWVEL